MPPETGRFVASPASRLLLCAVSVFSVSLWLFFLVTSFNHRGTENTEIAQREHGYPVSGPAIAITRGDVFAARAPALIRMRSRSLTKPRSDNMLVPAPHSVLKSM